MDDLQFDRHALSLYRFYRERGCLVTFQLWTTEDGGEPERMELRRDGVTVYSYNTYFQHISSSIMDH